MYVTEETCRVCLGKQRLNSILKKNLVGKIMYCAAVEVTEDDELPKMICNQCLFYLDVAYIFRTVCEATDSKLRKYFHDKKRLEHLASTKPLIQQKSEAASKRQEAEDVPNQQNTEDIPRQDPEDIYFINSPVANEVVIGEEDFEVDIILSACEESCSSTEVESKTPPLIDIDASLRTPDNKENTAKIGRHTARKINARVAKRVPTLKETFKSEKLQHGQVEKIPENSDTTDVHSESPLEENTEESLNKDESGKTHQCNHCNKSFPYKSYLQRHMTVHFQNKKYKCPNCDKKFINRNNLKVHMQIHSGDFPYKCKVCGRGFAWPSVLQRHLITHASTAEFQCQYCSKKMLHLSSLKLHEKMHLYQPSYTCDVCFKTFAYTNSLATHKKTHRGVKDNVCEICKKQFARKTSLRRHMLIHLRKHMLVHSKTKNFNFKVRLKPTLVPKGQKLNCDECNRRFGSKALLVKHLKQHEHN